MGSTPQRYTSPMRKDQLGTQLSICRYHSRGLGDPCGEGWNTGSEAQVRVRVRAGTYLISCWKPRAVNTFINNSFVVPYRVLSFFFPFTSVLKKTQTSLRSRLGLVEFSGGMVFVVVRPMISLFSFLPLLDRFGHYACDTHLSVPTSNGF